MEHKHEDGSTCTADHGHNHAEDQGFSWVQYKPLMIILAFCFVLAFAHKEAIDFSGHAFMGYFFVFFALFKFFDLQGFVDGFATYDLVTARYRPYGYAYPFIEFILGFAYLAQFNFLVLDLITLVVMVVAAAGVIQSLMAGKKIQCVCLGTGFNLPLSTVSVVENVGMALMALLGIFF